MYIVYSVVPLTPLKKVVGTKQDANKVLKALTAAFGVPFQISEVKDTWELPYSK